MTLASRNYPLYNLRTGAYGKSPRYQHVGEAFRAKCDADNPKREGCAVQRRIALWSA